MKRLILFLLCTFSLSLLHGQEIKFKKTKKNTYEYWVESNPWINYTWTYNTGQMKKNSNAKICLTSPIAPTSVSVTESPKFPSRTFRVKDFGARGNGKTNDTKAIQKASDALYSAGGGTLLFEPNKTYIVTSVVISESIHYKGNNTTIKRPAGQSKWTRTFRTDYNKTFVKESKPLKISGFRFDGNRMNQGPYKNYQLQQAHLIYLACGMKPKNLTQTGRLKAFIEDCHFVEAVGDGISQNVNVDLTVRNCDAKNVFRGGYVCTGGNSVAKVYDFTTNVGDIRSGIDIEIDAMGYGKSYKVDLLFDNLTINEGDCDIAVRKNSTIIIKNSNIHKPPITIYGPYSDIHFINTVLNFSNQKGSKSKYITFPNNLFFDNCDIILNRANRRCIGSALFLRNYVSGKSYKANLRLKNCRFKTKGITKADNAYGIVYYNDASTINKLKITMDNVTFDEGFIAPIGYMRYVKGVFCDTKIVDAKMKGNQILLKQLDAPEKIYTNFGHLQE